MGYIEQNLVPGEKLVYKTGWHWIVILWSIIGGLVLGAAGIALLVWGSVSGKRGLAYPELSYLGIGVLVLAVVVIASGIVRRAATEVAVSTKRVLIKTGLFSRRSIEVLLTKVESIGIEETFAGRMLGYGTVVIRGTGGTYETFDRIAHPNELRRQVQQQTATPEPR